MKKGVATIEPAVATKADVLMATALVEQHPEAERHVRTGANHVHEECTAVLQAVHALLALPANRNGQASKNISSEHPLLAECSQLIGDIERELEYLPPVYRPIEGVERPGRHLHHLQHLSSKLEDVRLHLHNVRLAIGAPEREIASIALRLQAIETHMVAGNGSTHANKFVGAGQRLSHAAALAERRRAEEHAASISRHSLEAAELRGNRDAIYEAIAEGKMEKLHLVAHGNDGTTTSFKQHMLAARETLREIDRFKPVQDYRSHFGALYRKCVEGAKAQIEKERLANMPPSVKQRTEQALTEYAVEFSTTMAAIMMRMMQLPQLQWKPPTPILAENGQNEPIDWKEFMEEQYTKIERALLTLEKDHPDLVVEFKTLLAKFNKRFDELAHENFFEFMDMARQKARGKHLDPITMAERGKRKTAQMLAQREREVKQQRRRMPPKMRPNDRPFAHSQSAFKGRANALVEGDVQILANAVPDRASEQVRRQWKRHPFKSIGYYIVRGTQSLISKRTASEHGAEQGS